MKFIREIQKKETLVILFLCIGLILFVAYVIVYTAFKPMMVSYDTLGIGEGAGLVVLNPMTGDGGSGAFFLRLNDGLQHFIPGDWNVYRIADSEIFLLDENIVSGPDGEIKFYSVNENTVDYVTVGNVNGNVVSVEANADGSGILFEVEKEDTTSFCATRFVENGFDTCITIMAPTDSEGIWNEENVNEVLILHTPDQQLLRYDLNDPGFKEVMLEDEEYEKLHDMFSVTADDNGGVKVKKFLSWVSVDGGERDVVVSVPLFSDVSLLLNDEFLLIKSLSQISLVKIDSGEEAVLYYGDVANAELDALVE